MNRKILRAVFFLVVVPTISFSQTRLTDLNFTSVDSFARTVKYEHDLAMLTSKLSAPYTDSIYKLRAIFIWITDNIEYDYKLLNKGIQSNFSCYGTKEVCDAAKTKWEDDFVLNVLEKKKGLCSGYALLFKKMCGLAGINNDLVDGYVKQNPFQLGLPLNISHSWNEVTINGTNYFFDPTWAAGRCNVDENGKPTSFIKYYEDYYWLTPFKKFSRNHYPKDDKWMKELKYDKELFFNSPYFYSNEVLKSIASHAPDTSILVSKLGDTIHFSFNCNKKIDRIAINTNIFKNLQVWAANASSPSAGIYQFDYVIKENSLYYIDILFDAQPAIRYRVKY